MNVTSFHFKKKTVFWVLFSLAVGALSSWLTRSGLKAFDLLEKPPLTPPRWVFPVVWSLLLCLIGFGYALAREKAVVKQTRDRVDIAYAVQMVFFFCWMLWFFGQGWFGFAAIWLVGMLIAIAWMIVSYRKISKLAAQVQVPYLLWCVFALYLNIGVYVLNR